MIQIIPVLAIISGACVYGLASNTKLSEGGRLLMGSGMLVTLFEFAHCGLRLVGQ